MFTSLSPGAIGVAVDSLDQGLALAARHGFAGYHFAIDQAVELGVAQVQDLCGSHGVRLSAWGFPVDFRGDEGKYRSDLEKLPAQAETAAQLGVLRTATWLMPTSDEMTYEENFAFHVERLRPAAAILADAGISLGLEYVAPKTLWASKAHPFVHTMAQTALLCEAVGANVGFLLDCWHWYNAGEGVEDLQGLALEQVVDVHVNDAPAGVPVDEQLDNVRTLPGETGVIDIAGFLGALRAKGYSGPVMVEPFSQRLREMAADEACAATGAALRRVWG
ncbi:MAG: TIM barrel protein [Candidatus Latescibacteria bacterium]|nr:TIM barrel protein [Candidatus Latescibacterota bacterium]